MTDYIPAVSGNKPLVINAEFVKLTIYNDYSNTANVTVHTFSSSYQPEIIDGQLYSPVGGLLAVGTAQRDLRVTSADTSLSLSGIASENIYIVLATKIKGSKLEIVRGFYDSNYILTSTAHRFTGIVTSYNINEDRKDTTDNYTVTLNASSFKAVLENRIVGRKTNNSSWTYYNPGDTSMSQVYSLSGTTFNFGGNIAPVITNNSASALESQVSSQSNPFRGSK
jgi:hypothetical protein